MKKKIHLPIIVFIICFFISVIAPLSVSADNGGSFWTPQGQASLIKFSPLVFPGDTVSLSVDSKYWTYTGSESAKVFIVPFTILDVGSNYFNSVYNYCLSNSIFSANLTPDNNILSVNADLTFTDIDNYVVYVLSTDTYKGASYNFIYSNAFKLNKFLNPDTFHINYEELNSSYDVLQQWRFTVDNTSNGLNLNNSIVTSGSTGYGRFAVSLENIVFDFSGKNDVLLKFDDFSIYNYAGYSAAFIVYINLVDNSTGESYAIGVIDNLNSYNYNAIDSYPYQPYYFLLDREKISFEVFDDFGVTSNLANFSLEFSFRYTLSSGATDPSGNYSLETRIQNLNFYSVKDTDITNESITNNILNALNDPSIGSFENNFDIEAADQSSSDLDNTVGDYSALESDIMDNADVNIDYYGNPLDNINLLAGIGFWASGLERIYNAIPLFQVILPFAVTAGIIAVIVGILGRPSPNPKGSNKGSKNSNQTNQTSKRKKGG